MTLEKPQLETSAKEPPPSDQIKIYDSWDDDDLIMPGADEETRWMF